MQAVGSHCSLCNERIVIAGDGVACEGCGLAYHKQCLSRPDSCPRCGEAFGSTAGAADRARAGVRRIEGWLILPGIGLIVSPVELLLGVLRLLRLAGEVRDGRVLAGVAVSLLCSVGLLVMVFVVAADFFAKRRTAPAKFIALLWVSLAVSVLNALLWVTLVWDLGFTERTLARLVIPALACAIWVRYFRVSRRVKATFVN